MTYPIDQRTEWTRSYPRVEVPRGGTSVEVRAGDDSVDGIRGWILVFGFPEGGPREDQIVVGRLGLRYPLLANVTHWVDGFDAGTGGAFLVPWPYISLTFRDAQYDSKAPAVTEEPPVDGEWVSRIAVSFFPVTPTDPAPPGLGSVVYGRRNFRVNRAGTEVEIPDGATEYRVLPTTISGPKQRITVTEKTGHQVWARYTIDPHEPLASGAALGRSAWTTTPLEPGAKLTLESEGKGERYATVYWRFDLGQSR